MGGRRDEGGGLLYIPFYPGPVSTVCDAPSPRSDRSCAIRLAHLCAIPRDLLRRICSARERVLSQSRLSALGGLNEQMAARSSWKNSENFQPRPQIASCAFCRSHDLSSSAALVPHSALTFE